MQRTAAFLAATIASNAAAACADPIEIAEPTDTPDTTPPTLTDPEPPRLTFGGHARARLEWWSNSGFSDANDDTFLLTRLLLNANYRFNDNASATVELKTVHATRRDLPGGRRPIDADSFDVQAAYLKAGFDLGDDARLTVTAGRQPLGFGRQRLISPLPWANNSRSFDGGRLTLNASAWTAEAFYTRLVAVDKYDLNDWTSGTDVFGLYATRALGEDHATTLDLYYLGIDRDTATFNTTTGHEQRHTVGARVAAPLAGFDNGSTISIDAEAAYQFGSVGTADVNAYSAAAELVWKLADTGWMPAITLGVDYASGDDEPGGDVETFNQLLPLGHAYFGYADTVGRQNIIDASIGFAFHPHQRVKVKADVHAFWRASTDDALYNAGGAVVRPGTTPGSEVGQELDLTVFIELTESLKAQAGVSYLFAGDFIRNSATSDDIAFAYTQLQFSF